MAEYGITELGLARVISLSYDLLGLISFFTVGADEVRAWTIHRGLLPLKPRVKFTQTCKKGLFVPR